MSAPAVSVIIVAYNSGPTLARCLAALKAQAFTNYEILLESGVQIYQYTPGFIHSKSFVCDDEVATVGTINMDYRSMYLHFECGVWMYGSSAVAQVKEDALITFEQCEQINMDYCRKKNFAVRALRGALKFLAPLL